MHLPKPFFRLPRRFDSARLREEVAAIPAESWVPHPNGIAGNSSVRLISVDGGENDLVDGIMHETAHLARLPYVRQVLAGFGVPWSRTRLLKLAGGAAVPTHADINYHWFYRVRLHIPIVTRPEVRFHCGGTDVHMAAGEAWIFDNWRLHNVLNPTPDERIHLVADTAGNAAFWQLVGTGEIDSDGAETVRFQPDLRPSLLTERSQLRPVMNPAELELLVGNLRGELVLASDTNEARVRLGQYHALLDAFVRDWRHHYSLHGEDESGWNDFARLRDSVRSASRPLGDKIALRTNRVAAHQVLEGRVLRVCVGAESDAPNIYSTPPLFAGRVHSPAGRASLTQPLFIVAAPRSGSTLLFESLAASDQIATLGGEAHWLIESIPDLSPGAPGIDSNRLSAAAATPHIADRIHSQILERLVAATGQPLRDSKVLRFLEKTPKNALRIPFFDRLFPDARFIFLWREPRANISSIMQAWRSGRWRTYPRLEGFVLPWSLLLPPGWEEMQGRPLEEIAAFQWQTTNLTILDDLSALAAERWTMVNYDNFLAEPAKNLARLSRFAGLEYDAGLAKRASGPLPAAQHTLTPADPHKWQKDAAEIEKVLPAVQSTWQRLIETSHSAK
jgi:Sulfotransferase family/Aspartyl/Asparaginyl beta-hydroxylase